MIARMSTCLLLNMTANKAALFLLILHLMLLISPVLQVLGPGFRLSSLASSNRMASFRDG